MSTDVPQPEHKDRSVLPGDGKGWRQFSLRTTGEMAPIIGNLTQEMAAFAYPENDVDGTHLAVQEALTNAIRHGNHQDPGKEVIIRYHINESRVVIEVEDQGEGFEPARVADPLALENLEKPGGRGLFLMRNLMSWLHFNERGNCVILGKHNAHRSGPAEANPCQAKTNLEERDTPAHG